MQSRDPESQRNLLLAVVLSTLVLLGWQYFFAVPQMRQEQAKREFAKSLEAQQKGQPGAATVPGVASPDAPVIAAPNAVPITPEAERRSREDSIKSGPRIAVETASLTGSISLKGGRIDDLILKKYREQVDPKSPNVILLSPAGSTHPYFAEYGWIAGAGTQAKLPDRETVWTATRPTKLTAATPVVLTWDNGQGLLFKRTIAVDDEYLFTVRDEVENKGAAEVTLLPYARIYRYNVPASLANWILHEGLIGVAGTHGLKYATYHDAAKSGAPITHEQVTGGWLGITDKYWAAALVPDQTQPFRMMLSALPKRSPQDHDAFQADYLRNAIAIPSGGRTEVEAKLYAGAKQATLIDTYEEKFGIKNFELMIDWGWFYFITKPLFHLMEFINSHVGNFGVTILILTILVRLAFFPLANKQYEAMARMKKLQPEMQRIRDRYAEDKQRQQKEMFDLYRKEKVNPVAGCWPILLQIPVFFALYKVLFITIDMRHAPFFGWIKDLSAPDPTSIFNLFGLLPFEVPLFLMVGVWPLLMGITMWLQMQLNPQQPDPVQQQIFNWMPVLFTFLLASFPAGLVIYWTWSNVLSIAQQWYITKKQGAEIHIGDNLRKTFAPVLRLFGAKTDAKPGAAKE